MKRSKLWKKTILFLLGVPLLLFFTAVVLAYIKQDVIVQHLLEDVNADFTGAVEIEESHISLFEDFPYISIDLQNVKIHETKEKKLSPLVDVKDIYVGFDLFTILSGSMEIKKIKLKEGKLNIVQHKNGEFNIANALKTKKEIENVNDEFHLNLKKIELENIDLTKLNEANNILFETYIPNASSSFKSSNEHIYISLDSRFTLNLIANNDTTFIKHKHFQVSTEIDFFLKKEIMKISPTVVKLENATFNMEGTIDFLNDAFLDLQFNGNKSNFDLLIAMAPEELIPALKKYENKGKIYFDASIKGKSINGYTPAINAKFGCEDAFLNNFKVNKKLDELNFVGFFTNGSKRDLTTMEFGIKDFTAKPEAGKFTGNLHVKNFQSPEINLQIVSDFELEFLAKFFNINDLKDLKGKISLTMNFNDIIDLEFPEKSIEKLNEAYYMKLLVENLSFSSDSINLPPIKNISLSAEVIKHKATIQYCNVLIGKSDLSLSGTISDLPAILHHTKIPVSTDLKIKSNYLDLFELTGADSTKSFNEQIEKLSLNLKFNSSAKAFTESPHLPIGEFFIDNLYAKLKHYPHTFHDFHADVFIENENFKVVDFKGMIDKSDFFFSGKLSHYDLWFSDKPSGDTKIEFSLVSNLLQLQDLFSYKGENYVPEDYRHEEFKSLKLHGFTEMHFKDSLKSIDLTLDMFDAKMKIHTMRFENFNGKVHYENDHLMINNFSGKIGKSDFKTTLHYYFGKDEKIKKRDNHFEFISSHLDFDELFNYHPLPDNGQKNHDTAFNIYSLPFTDMTYLLKIGHLKYHKYLINNIDASLRTTPKHYLYIDKLLLDAAGGSFDIAGYFNGSNPKLIYFTPTIKVKNVELDKLMLKFDNFGQDHLVSENLHGKFSGTISGKIHMHTDLVPKIDDSEIHIDLNVINGRLENYALLDCMSDYFKDKNLKKVLFDTLSNHIDLTKGVLTIPKMKINTSLGFMEISGKQDLNMNIEYYIKIPLKMVTDVAASKLFGKKAEEVDADQIDAIQYADPEKKIKYINLKITGNSENYKFSLGKNKSSNKN